MPINTHNLPAFRLLSFEDNNYTLHNMTQHLIAITRQEPFKDTSINRTPFPKYPCLCIYTYYFSAAN